MRRFMVLVILAACIPFYPQSSYAQSSEELKALKEEIKALKEGQRAIRKDLQEIKILLRARWARPAFKETVISVKGEPFKGNKDARLAIIEFFEYQ